MPYLPAFIVLKGGYLKDIMKRVLTWRSGSFISAWLAHLITPAFQFQSLILDNLGLGLEGVATRRNLLPTNSSLPCGLMHSNRFSTLLLLLRVEAMFSDENSLESSNMFALEPSHHCRHRPVNSRLFCSTFSRQAASLNWRSQSVILSWRKKLRKCRPGPPCMRVVMRSARRAKKIVLYSADHNVCYYFCRSFVFNFFRQNAARISHQVSRVSFPPFFKTF